MTDLCDPSRQKSLKTKVKSVLAYAIKDKMEKFQSEIIKVVKIFDEIGFAFNFRNLTFTDNIGREYKIAYLASQKMKDYPFIDQEDIETLASSADKITNWYRDIEPYLNEGTLNNIIARIQNACSARKAFIREHGNLMSEITGKYQSDYDENVIYYISTDPFDIFTKSTGRSWSPANCERAFGDSEIGIYSDISHNSAVVFILDKRIKGFESAIARMNLRLCVVDEEANDPKERYSIGWDINWYQGKHSHDRLQSHGDQKFANVNLTANQAREEIVKIAKNRGFKMDYITCTTPFAHEGYSDIESSKNAFITYRSKYNYFCEECGVATKKRFYRQFGGLCPVCYKKHHN